MKSHASMNRIYRLVWNEALNLWVAVAENAKGRSKGGSSRSSVEFTSTAASGGFWLKSTCRAALALLSSLVFAGAVQAADAANATVSAGVGNVATVGNTTTVTQGSNRLAIDWTSLSTRANEALIFNQPNASAIALNRITGSSPSELLGSLTANGQVFILNPNGVLFGAGSQVNVGGLVASTLSMGNADFMAGSSTFSNNGGSGTVVNQGTLTAARGGYVALLAPEVRNEGVVVARLGTALLAAGNKVTLNLNNGSLLGYSIDQGAINALAGNKQLIQAQGGQVLMGARALDALTTASVNNSGIIEARTVANQSGRIMLMGDMEHGTVNVGGRLDASAPVGGDGGFIETSAAHVNVLKGARVTTLAPQGQTGEWLIDPNDFTIAVSGGNMTGASVGINLATTDVTISTATMGTPGGNGDIFVNDAVSWSSNNKLTLTAERNIEFNAPVTAIGASAGLALNYTGDYKVNMPVTLGGANATLDINGASYTLIHSMAEFEAIDSAAYNTRYALAQDLDASGKVYTQAVVSELSGTFTGLGHVIDGLTIHSTQDNIGLFAVSNAATMRDIGLTNVDIRGNNSVGALLGGGVAGTGYVRNSYSTGSVAATGMFVGGLVGESVQIDNSFSTASVSGTLDVGGLIGRAGGGNNITNSYASGSVSGSYVGGLVGFSSSNINNSYATGAVNGSSYAGGLAGLSEGNISNSYATGAVYASAVYGGGLVGSNPGSINLSYATGAVTGVLTSFLGGLVGTGAPGNVTQSYWNKTTSGMATSRGGTGLTDAQMQNTANFVGFDFASTPGAGGNNWVTFGTGAGRTRPMLASEYSTSIRNAHQLQLMGMNLNARYTVGQNIDAAATASGKDVWTAAGFVPVGNYATSFSGSLDGQGHAISALKIDTGVDGAGLFGVAEGSEIRNVDLLNVDIRGNLSVGALIGEQVSGMVGNVRVSGTVRGTGIAAYVGGLVGYNSGTVTGSGSSATVSGDSSVGGLVGENAGTVQASYAAGKVTSTGSGTGGLIGTNLGQISNSYATGEVVSDGFGVGGLVGTSDGDISNSYSSGAVTGAGLVGGLVGLDQGNVNASFWNIQTSGQATSAAGLGKTTAQMQQASTFTNVGWDLSSAGGVNTVWRIYEGQTGPLLRSFLKTLTLGDTTVTYNGSVQTAAVPAGVYGTFASGKNAGTYFGGNNYYSDQQGYDILGGNATLTIDKAVLTATATAADKVYSGGVAAAMGLTITGGLVAGETVTVLAYGNFNSKDVGVADTATVAALTLLDGTGGGLADNYTLAVGQTASANITARAIKLNGTRAYDGTTAVNGAAFGSAGTLTGVLGETLLLTGSGSVADKNVASGLQLVNTGGLSLADGSGLASNYSIGTSRASISKAQLTATATAADKVYSGGTAASVALTITDGLIDGETLGTRAAGRFNSKDVLDADQVTVSSVALTDGSGGGLASNYQLAAGQQASAHITPKALKVVGMTAQDKFYDHTTTATLLGGSLQGVVSGETLGFTGSTGNFITPGIANNKTVIVTGTTLVDGSGSASNYSVKNPTGLKASIKLAPPP
jgi:filamentous hemagglutinin family protein